MSAGPRAVIFDCDGVIADSEPLHLRVFRAVLAPRGIAISSAEYAERYLGLDDRGVFAEALRVHGSAPAAGEVGALVVEKARRFRSVLEAEVRIYPGVVAFVRSLTGVPLAVASGALRDEVELILSRAGIRDAFAAVVAAEDVTAGKPDPEGFLRALAALEREAGAIAPAAGLDRRCRGCVPRGHALPRGGEQLPRGGAHRRGPRGPDPRGHDARAGARALHVVAGCL